MGHGAPKRVDVIPTQLIVNIFAWEGLLYESQKKLGECLKAILDGDESLWDELNTLRISVINYNKQYTKAILSLQISQKG